MLDSYRKAEPQIPLRLMRSHDDERSCFTQCCSYDYKLKCETIVIQVN